MRTYLIDTLNKYKRISKSLDAKAVLCNKSWQVFNNSGEKEIYIFQEDGSLIISINGKAIIAKWSFITANDTVLISHNESSFMMKPFFNDDKLFVLQLDGTNEYSFLIDESIKASFRAKTLNELELYIKGAEFIIEKKKTEIETQPKTKFDYDSQIKMKSEYDRKIYEAQKRITKSKNDLIEKTNDDSKYLNDIKSQTKKIKQEVNISEPQKRITQSKKNWSEKKNSNSESSNETKLQQDVKSETISVQDENKTDWITIVLWICFIGYIFCAIMVYFTENPEGRSFISVLLNIKG